MMAITNYSFFHIPKVSTKNQCIYLFNLSLTARHVSNINNENNIITRRL